MAACSKGNRVDHRDAECLSASWNNRGVFRKSPYHVRNMCPEYGSVVAKVDLKSAMDRTLHLDDGEERDGSTLHRIRGISCCSDSGELCNRSDVVTNNGCIARFRRASPASATCWTITVAASVSGDDFSCTVSAYCDVYNNPSMSLQAFTRIRVPFLALDEVHNCRGRLTRGPCPTRTTRLTVTGAEAREAAGASLDFPVTLNRPHSETVTVRYSTSDVSARAGPAARRIS